MAPMIYPDRSPAPDRITRHPSVNAALAGKEYDPAQIIKIKLDCGCPNATAKFALVPIEVLQEALINNVPQNEAYLDARIRGQIGADGTMTARQQSDPPSEFKVSDMALAARQAVAMRLLPFTPAWGNVRQERVDLLKSQPNYQEWLHDHGFEDPSIPAIPKAEQLQ